MSATYCRTLVGLHRALRRWRLRGREKKDCAREKGVDLIQTFPPPLLLISTPFIIFDAKLSQFLLPTNPLTSPHRPLVLVVSLLYSVISTAFSPVQSIHPLIGFEHSKPFYGDLKNTKAWMKMDENGWKWMKVDESSRKGMSVDDSGWMWTKVDECGRKWMNVDYCGWKWMNVVKCG